MEIVLKTIRKTLVLWIHFTRETKTEYRGLYAGIVAMAFWGFLWLPRFIGILDLSFRYNGKVKKPKRRRWRKNWKGSNIAVVRLEVLHAFQNRANFLGEFGIPFRVLHWGGLQCLISFIGLLNLTGLIPLIWK